MICVTGATGFLGRAVVQRLYDTCRPFKRPEGNLLEPGVAKRYVQGCEAVIHLAGETNIPERMFAHNVTVTQLLLQASAAAGVQRFCYVSSIAVTQCFARGRWTPYAISKLTAEVMVEAERTRMHTVVLRLPTIYGGHGWRSWPIMAVKSLCYRVHPHTMQSVTQAVDEILTALDTPTEALCTAAR